MKIRNYQLRYAAGMYWLLDMSQTGEKATHPVGMNECGAMIWGELEKGMSDVAITALLCKQYGLSEQEAKDDLKVFLKQLDDHNILYR